MYIYFFLILLTRVNTFKLDFFKQFKQKTYNKFFLERRFKPVQEEKTITIKHNKKLFKSLRIKAPTIESMVGGLSGGNQQKVVLAKALMTQPSLVFLDEPTRGIDVGAKLEVYELINQLTEQGKAVILVSSEMPELLGMSDRIIVLSDGKIGGEFVSAQTTQEQLLQAAMTHELQVPPFRTKVKFTWYEASSL